MTDLLILKFTDCLERKNPDHYHPSNVVSDVRTTQMCHIGSITLQCGVSSGKQKLTVILVSQSSMQVTMGTWCMHKQCVPGSLFHREPVNEANGAICLIAM